MFLQTAVSGEGLWTLITFEGFVFLMHQLMNFQITHSSKLSATHITLERLFTYLEDKYLEKFNALNGLQVNGGCSTVNLKFNISRF